VCDHDRTHVTKHRHRKRSRRRLVEQLLRERSTGRVCDVLGIALAQTEVNILTRQDVESTIRCDRQFCRARDVLVDVELHQRRDVEPNQVHARPIIFHQRNTSPRR
jgi:hypothetical protein